jgi:hypothetical protein
MIDPQNVDSLKTVLRTIDKPFIAHVWQSSLETKDPVGNMLRMLASLPQYKTLTWENSVFESTSSVAKRQDDNDETEYLDPTVSSNRDKIVSHKVSDELYKKWGRSFKPSEILDFEEAYENLAPSFQIENANQEGYLKLACINQVKAMYAMATDRTKEAKDYMDMFHKITQAGNLQPAQNKKDLTQGINSFSEMVKKVEQSEDVIHILPQFRERPQDKVDIVIWAFVNYIRNLKGLSDVTYEEIWRWYDSRKKAYEDMLARIVDLDKEEEIIEEDGDE